MVAIILTRRKYKWEWLRDEQDEKDEQILGKTFKQSSNFKIR